MAASLETSNPFSCQEAVELYNEMKLKREYAYLSFAFGRDDNYAHLCPDKIATKSQFNINVLVADNMNIIISHWFRIYNEKKKIDTNTFSLIIKEYFDETDDEFNYELILKEIHETDHCCYFILDYFFDLIFILWIPDTAKAKEKILHSAYAQDFKRYLDDISTTITASNKDKLTEMVIMRKLLNRLKKPDLYG